MRANSPFTRAEKSWITYDAGNSAFTMLTSSIIPIYFASLVEKDGFNSKAAMDSWALVLSVATLIVALLSPILGTLADYKGMKIKFFTGGLILGLAGCVSLGLVNHWVAYLLAFVIAKVGFSSTLVFYDAMLTDVTTDERMDRVSTQGFAIGYITSCLPFAICMGLILGAKAIGLTTVMATQLSFFLTGAWWLIFSIPLIKGYKQTYGIDRHAGMISASFKRLWGTLRDIPKQKPIFLFMLAFFFYIDGVYTIIGMAASYGKAVGIDSSQMIMALLLTQIVAFPCAILFGVLANHFKTLRLIEVCVLGYFGITLFAVFLHKPWQFWVLAVCVGFFQGGIQALSRSYFAKIIPKDRANEYFGLFDIFGKYADFFGPLLMLLFSQVTGQANLSVLSIAILFIVGFVLLRLLRRYEGTNPSTGGPAT